MSGVNEQQLIQLSGEPMTISLYPNTHPGTYSAGRLCWMERSMKGFYGFVTQLFCAKLSSNGRQIIQQEKVREFSNADQPSWAMSQHTGSLFWSDAYK